MTTDAPATPFDVRAFRNALGCFPTGVAVITTHHQGVPVGLTCNSFSSVSLDPPLVLWSLRQESRALQAFREADGFAINILAEDQTLLSAHFASRVEDKFATVDWRPGLRGLPLLENCLTSFECSTFAQHEAGDHVVFIGRVDRFDQPRTEDPLVFFRGAYMMLTESLREMAAKGRINDESLAEARLLVYGMLLRLAARNGSADDFDAIAQLLAQIDGMDPAADVREYAARAVRFLDLIAQSAHNEVLAVVARSLTTMLLHQAQASQGATPAQRASLSAARAEMLAALRQGNADGALDAFGRYAEAIRPGGHASAKLAQTLG